MCECGIVDWLLELVGHQCRSTFGHALKSNQSSNLCTSRDFWRAYITSLVTHYPTIIMGHWTLLSLCLSCTDGKGRLSNPVLLASGGLLSGIISARKNWLAL